MLFLILHLILAEFLVVYISNIEAPSNVKLFTYRTENSVFLIIANIILIFLSVLFTIYSPDYLWSFFVRVSIIIVAYAMVDLGVHFLSSSECVGRVASMVIKLIAFSCATILLLFGIDNMEYSLTDGFVVEAAVLFETFISVNWFTLAILVFVYIVPLVCIVIAIIHNVVLKRYAKLRQMLCDLLSLLIPWLSVPFIAFVLQEHFPFASLLVFIMAVGIETMIVRRVSRSDARKSNVTFFVFNASQYLLPAVIMGVAYRILLNFKEENVVLFWLLLSVIAILDLYFTHAYGEIIINFRRNHNKKIINRFEKQLKSIDFSLDRLEVAQAYSKALKKYIRASEMAVYSNDGNEHLVSVYDSRDPEKTEIDVLDFTKSMETFLLKSSRTILRKSDLDAEVEFGSNKTGFTALYTKMKATGFIVIYNKNHVSALIFLGRKTDNSDYTKYDIETVRSLYSFFFIFTYYILNVASRKSQSVIESDNLAVKELNDSISKYKDPGITEKYDTGSFIQKSAISSGDFYDSIELGNNKHLFILGTVSGMGLASTVAEMLLKETIHSLLPSTPDFKQLVVKINKFIYNFMPKGTIFSGMFAIADFASDNFYYINCGIQSVSVFANDLNKIYEVKGDGRVLGFVEDISHLVTVQKRHLKKDDIIFSYTSGIVESNNITTYYKNQQRIQNVLLANTQYNSERIARYIYEDFENSDDINSDVSILIIRRKA